MPQGPHSVQSRFPDGTVQPGRNAKIGKVFLVGAGPGDPGLITVRGAQLLSQADVVLFDGLANPQLLALAAQAEQICVGKHGAGPLWSQEKINASLIDLAQSGLKVVRLKGGDPAVFARTAEELEALTKAKIPFEVVPGITAALAAASYVGIPITHRDHASAVAFITGQQQESPAQELDWPALARFPGTLVFYMGVTTAGQWSQRLIAEGKSPQTPAAIIRRCSWPDQKVIRCTLADIEPELTPTSKLRPPVLVIIGQVAQLGNQFNWFDDLPLRGHGVWLPRPQGQNSFLSNALQELGAQTFEYPVMNIVPPADLAPLDAAIEQLAGHKFQGIGLTSRNAVDALMARIWQLGYDSRILSGTTIACVGDKTSEQLTKHGLRADIVPSGNFSAADLLATIEPRNIRGQNWLLPQADQARDALADGLMQQGASVQRVIAYRSLMLTELPTELKIALQRGQIGWVMVTSPSIAKSLFDLSGEHREHLKPISLSTAISEQLALLGWPAHGQASQATEEELLVALTDAATSHEQAH